MSPQAYTDDRLVEQPAIPLFAEGRLTWESIRCSRKAKLCLKSSPCRQAIPHGYPS
jgi:hypothetical protein